MSKVTPIRPGVENARNRRRRPSKRGSLTFNGPSEGDPSSLRVWQALLGVCHASEETAEGPDASDQMLRLGTAASILAEILDQRMTFD